MSAKVMIPTPLRKLANDSETAAVSAGSIGTLIAELESQFPGFGARLTDENGNLRRFVNIYLNEEDIRFIAGKDTAINDGDTISIVPAIAGG